MTFNILRRDVVVGGNEANGDDDAGEPAVGEEGIIEGEIDVDDIIMDGDLDAIEASLTASKWDDAEDDEEYEGAVSGRDGGVVQESVVRLGKADGGRKRKKAHPDDFRLLKREVEEGEEEQGEGEEKIDVMASLYRSTDDNDAASSKKLKSKN